MSPDNSIVIRPNVCTPFLDNLREESARSPQEQRASRVAEGLLKNILPKQDVGITLGTVSLLSDEERAALHARLTQNLDERQKMGNAIKGKTLEIDPILEPQDAQQRRAAVEQLVKELSGDRAYSLDKKEVVVLREEPPREEAQAGAAAPAPAQPQAQGAWARVKSSCSDAWNWISTSRLGRGVAWTQRAAHQHLPGVAALEEGATVHIVKAAKWAKGTSADCFDAKIEDKRRSLRDLTGDPSRKPGEPDYSNVVAESCRAMASFIADHIIHQIKDAESIEPEMRPPFIQKMFHEGHVWGSQQRGFVGNTLKQLVADEGNKKLLIKTLEFNILKFTERSIRSAKTYDQHHLSWRVQFFTSLFEEYSNSFETLQRRVQDDDTPLLNENLFQKLLPVLLPEGEDEIELPPGAELLAPILGKKELFALLTNAQNDMRQNPRMMRFFRTALDKGRALLAEKAMASLSNMVSGGDARKQPIPIFRERHALQHLSETDKAAFRTEFQKIGKKLCFAVDPNRARRLDKFFLLTPTIAGCGEVFLEKLQRIDLMKFTNYLLAESLKDIVDGSWAGEERRKRFERSGTTSFTDTRQQFEASIQKKKTEEKEQIRKTQEIIGSITNKTKGLANIIAQGLITIPDSEERDRIARSGTLEEKVFSRFRLMLHGICSFVINIGLWFVSDRLVGLSSAQAFDAWREQHLWRLLRPAEDVLIRRLEGQAAPRDGAGRAEEAARSPARQQGARQVASPQAPQQQAPQQQAPQQAAQQQAVQRQAEAKPASRPVPQHGARAPLQARQKKKPKQSPK